VQIIARVFSVIQNFVFRIQSISALTSARQKSIDFPRQFHYFHRFNSCYRPSRIITRLDNSLIKIGKKYP